ncbi:hypothetical protein M231_06359 [Tremella mesenterica]|uniref:Short-chain dehydrogenase n=1 Tax=Tremella mesenterica TaxID=5217 RepID=A0A4Q1BGE4_TREME|nr:hypothetical protein M231_06359 [Tremella mesenterica]
MSFKSFDISTLYSVKGKNVLITGGGTGVGKGMAIGFAMNGAKVIITGRRLQVIESTATEINAACKEQNSGGEVIPVQGDIATKAGVEAIYNICSQFIDRLDVLINNAGFSSNWKVPSKMDDVEQLQQKLWSIDDVDYANMTAVHVAGPYFMGVKFIPMFQKSDNPVIINITSLAAEFMNREVCEFSYAQSKAAEQQLTKLMSAALMPFKIRVNAISPGLFPSQLTTTGQGSLYPPMQRAADEIIPARRPGTWEEIAGPVMMMATRAGAYLNGVALSVDGGWLLTDSALHV